MSQMKIKYGDITKFKGDALVNAANSTLLGGGGVDGVIHRAAGPQLLVACRALNGCAPGEAKITKGYQLPVKYVIHTVGPIYHGTPADAMTLAACYRNSLNIALQYAIHTLAFPAISTGVYHYPLVPATQIAVQTVKQWIQVHPDYYLAVTFMCFDHQTESVYHQILNR